MGLWDWQMGAPIIFPIVAFGMATVAILVCSSIVKQKHRPEEIPISSGYTTYTGDVFSQPLTAYTHRRVTYKVPSHCPSCRAPITNEEVEWVGPLKAKCPSCMATIDAEESDF